MGRRHDQTSCSFDCSHTEQGMSKARRKGEGQESAPPSNDGVENASLAKVMTNKETPRCPFCKGVRLEAITVPNPFGRKWVCLDCCVQFREPLKGAA